MNRSKKKGLAAALVRIVIPPLLLLVVMLAVWQAGVVLFEIKPYLVPSPWAVLQTTYENAGKIISATSLTGRAALLGFLCSCTAGLGVGFLFSQSVWIRNCGYPYAIFLQTVPIVAIAPLIINWFGPGFHSVVIVSFIISLFPMITNATTGLTSTPPQLLELFRLQRAGPWQTMSKLRIPHAVGAMVTGARTASGLSVVGAIVGEFFAGYGARQFGLGYLIRQSAEMLKTDLLFASVGASAVLGVVIFSLASFVGYGLLAKWSLAHD